MANQEAAAPTIGAAPPMADTEGAVLLDESAGVGGGNGDGEFLS
jgi:hypothetical protein